MTTDRSDELLEEVLWFTLNYTNFEPINAIQGLLLGDFCIKTEIAYNGMEVRIHSQENVKSSIK